MRESVSRGEEEHGVLVRFLLVLQAKSQDRFPDADDLRSVVLTESIRAQERPALECGIPAVDSAPLRHSGFPESFHSLRL